MVNPPDDELASNGFGIYHERRSAGLVGRFFVTLGQLIALVFGAMNAYIQQPPAHRVADSLLVAVFRAILLFVRPFLDQWIIKQPFPIQFRLRLERLGPTYIKLGQIRACARISYPKSSPMS